MAAPINIDAYSDALVLLGTAGIVVPLARRWGLSTVLGRERPSVRWDWGRLLIGCHFSTGSL